MFSMNKPVYTQSDEAGGGTLYVGGLDPTVVDSNLFEIFSAVGPVGSVRVCRDRDTQKSLGYGYVNFQTVADAKRCLDTMNFTTIKGKSCRLMWKQKDSTERDRGIGNIHVKNLDNSIDNKTLFDTFSMFGAIRSCKVAVDKNGNSLGYGFVHYADEASAAVAISKIDGMMINEKKVQVDRYIQKKHRADAANKSFTNVYVKNFGPTQCEKELIELFKKFGEIDSSIIPKLPNSNENKGYAFCNFLMHEEAVKCIESLNGAELNGHTLVAQKYKSRNERSKEFDELTGGKLNVNLFVKNLDLTIDDDQLKALFGGFGTIVSHRVMKHRTTHESRGFGFVCYEKEADASKAMAEMNGKNVAGKDIYVGLAQKKKERAIMLAKEREKMTGTMPPPPGLPRGPFGAPPLPYNVPPAHEFGKRPPPPGMLPGMMFGPRPPFPGIGAPMGRGPPPSLYGRRPMPPPRNPVAVGDQKQALGEKLYPIVQRIEPQMAGKITGMLLEMEVGELHHLLESGGDLMLNKINEAVQILKMHQL